MISCVIYCNPFSHDENMGEFVELEAVGQGGVQPLDGYHLIIIRGMEDNHREKTSPTIEVYSHFRY